MSFFKQNIKIYINKRCKVDHYKLLSSCVFFVHDLFYENFESFEVLHICFHSKKEYGKECSCGRFYVLGNELFCEINLGLKTVYFDDYLKSVFFVLLHELGHAKRLLEMLEKVVKKMSCQDTHNIILEENYKIKLENKHLSEIEISRLIPGEIHADQFAFRNLSYFENLYLYNGFLL